MNTYLPNRQGRAAIFFWEGYLSVAPSLMNAIQLLRQSGIMVDVVIRTPFEEYPPITIPDGVRVIECLPLSVALKQWLTRRGFRKFSHPSGSPVPSQTQGNSAQKKTFYEALKSTLVGPLSIQTLLFIDYVQFMVFSFVHTFRSSYCALFGIDIFGLIAASFIAKFKRVPIIYWSLELHFMSKQPSWLHRHFKAQERRISQKMPLILIQDQSRAQSLIEENSLNAAQIRLVPNAPIGLPTDEPSTFFQDKFGLADETHVILQTGMISSEAMSLEVAKVTARWKPVYTLVLHERMKRNPSEHYLQEIEKVSNGRVYLSLTPVPFEEIDTVIKSGKVGLVLYRNDLGANYSNMVGASGKMAYYLRCGLPVVCMDLPGMRELVEKYNCGFCVRSLEEIEHALDQIFENYDAFSMNALKCYKERYEFSSFFQPIVDQIIQWCH